MPTIIGENATTSGRAAPYYKRMIRCPGHWLVNPKVDVYKREPVGLLKNCSNWVEWQGKKYDLKKTRIVKDAFGRKVIDWKKIYELFRKSDGSVLHPEVSAAWAIENVWDPHSMLCQLCDKRCKEGPGTILERTIGRLVGRFMKKSQGGKN